MQFSLKFREINSHFEKFIRRDKITMTESQSNPSGIKTRAMSDKMTMSESKNPSAIKTLAMNAIPVGKSIEENGFRRTVIESNVKYFKVERRTDAGAANLQNLNENVSNF